MSVSTSKYVSARFEEALWNNNSWSYYEFLQLSSPRGTSLWFV